MISKLQAVIDRKESVPIEKGNIVLYLGASHGITAKIISQLVGKKGFVFCLDISPNVMKDLLKLCKSNNNMCPLLEDANKPDNYKENVTKVGVIYQDLAQKNQVEIFRKNIDLFLKKHGFAILVLKAKSVDVTKSSEETLKYVKEQLSFVRVIKIIDISKTHKDHYFIICQKK